MIRPVRTFAILAALCSTAAQAQISPGYDSDRDGVADVVENSVLGTGDGNRDGVADAQQGQVVSFRFAYLGRGGAREGTVSNTELAPNRSNIRLTRVQAQDWSAFGGRALGSAPPVRIEATGAALVLQYELHGAGLSEGSRFYWLAANAGATDVQTYAIDVLGSSEQAGDSFVLTILDGAPNDLAKEQGVIRVIGFPR